MGRLSRYFASTGMSPEIQSELELLRTVMEERHQAYAEKFESAVALSLERLARIEQKFVEAERAVTKAEAASEKRFDAVNEFRAQLKDQQNLLIPRAEAVVKFDAISDRMAVLADALTRIRGQADGAHGLWVVLGGLAVLAISAIGLWIRAST